MIQNSDIAKLKGWIPVTKIILGKTHINGWIDKSEDNFVKTLPDWTHNIADAWGLLEEMTDCGINVQIYLSKDSATIDTTNPTTTGKAMPTTESAICQCWLKLKGAK